MKNKRIILLICLVLSLGVLFCSGCGSNTGEESQNEDTSGDKSEDKEEVQKYVVFSKKGKKLTFQEGFKIDHSILKDYLHFSAAFDLDEKLYSVVYDDRHETYPLDDGKIYKPGSTDVLGSYTLDGETVLVDARLFLEYFGATVMTEEDYEASLSDEDTEKKEDQKDKEIPKTNHLMVWDPSGRDSEIKFHPAIDIVIPRWLSLKEGDGTFNFYVNEDYIANVRGQGKSLWVLVTNSFDPDLTSEVLNSYSARKNMVDYLYNYAQTYGLDGIDMDFENIHLRDKDLYVQFIAELSCRLKEADISLSACVTVPGKSENWSKVFDRPRLAEYVDYLHLMAYDQHWASSQISGPVAAYDWVAKNLDLLTKDIPPHKFILGLPLYTRVWYERYSDTEPNKVVVDSESLYMIGAENLINKAENVIKVWDEGAQQNFYVFIDPKENAVVKLWYDDPKAIAKKASLAAEKGLSGMACWALGFEEPEVWDELGVIKDMMAK